MELVKVSNNTVDPIFAESFQNLFAMAETFSYAHVNFPSSIKDARLADSIKERLMKASSPSSAFNLMSNPQTRYFLVARIINAKLCKMILDVSCFEGFDRESDGKIAQYRGHLYQCLSSVFDA